MMKRNIILFVVGLLSLTVQAQKLIVEGMTVAGNDISASQYRVNDNNGDPCALVKVQLAVRGAKFAGSVIGTPEFKSGVYWVYMPAGVKELEVQHESFVPCHVNFGNYGIRSLQGLTTYVLTLLMPQTGNMNVDDGMRYLILNVSPKNSVVSVDGQLRRVDSDGTVSVYLPQGQHTYRVDAPGYASEENTVTIGDNKVTRQVTLQSVLARVTVSCPTTGARIYVNGQQRGASPWSGELEAGSYQLEARLTGYHSQQRTVSLTERSNEQIALPALVAMTGSLNVNYKPVDAEVWMDGKKLGTTPDVFRGVLVGNHSVEVRKAGYETLKQSVTIAEGQTAQLSGTLTAAVTQSTSSSSSSVSSAAVETFTVNGVSFNMVRVDGGELMIGNTIEQDSVSERGKVSQAKKSQKAKLFSFMIGETEVTQALWKAIMGNKNPLSDNDYSIPVDSVTWNDCQEFISKLNKLTGKKFRLPTEDEWEYAARGGNKSKHFKYSGSNVLNDVAWNEHNSGKTIHPIKTRKPNELNIYDMSGNVWEWCADILDWSHNQTQPPGNLRAYRGGSCTPYSSGCQVSSRVFAYPKETYRHIGFRLAL